MPTQAAHRVIVALTGASGACYGITLLQRLRERGDCETHVVISPSAGLTLSAETDFTRESVEALADVVHSSKNIGACIASGSFLNAGMVIAPCSMRTLAGVAMGLSDNLITRAADVILKERRRLILIPRETPLNLAHLRNMVSATEMGAIVLPPVPAFYQRPTTVQDIVDHTVDRTLDLLGLPRAETPRWSGL